MGPCSLYSTPNSDCPTLLIPIMANIIVDLISTSIQTNPMMTTPITLLHITHQ